MGCGVKDDVAHTEGLARPGIVFCEQQGYQDGVYTSVQNEKKQSRVPHCQQEMRTLEIVKKTERFFPLWHHISELSPVLRQADTPYLVKVTKKKRRMPGIETREMT